MFNVIKYYPIIVHIKDNNIKLKTIEEKVNENFNEEYMKNRFVGATGLDHLHLPWHLSMDFKTTIIEDLGEYTEGKGGCRYHLKGLKFEAEYVREKEMSDIYRSYKDVCDEVEKYLNDMEISSCKFYTEEHLSLSYLMGLK